MATLKSKRKEDRILTAHLAEWIVSVILHCLVFVIRRQRRSHARSGHCFSILRTQVCIETKTSCKHSSKPAHFQKAENKLASSSVHIPPSPLQHIMTCFFSSFLWPDSSAIIRLLITPVSYHFFLLQSFPHCRYGEETRCYRSESASAPILRFLLLRSQTQNSLWKLFATYVSVCPILPCPALPYPVFDDTHSITSAGNSHQSLGRGSLSLGST